MATDLQRSTAADLLSTAAKLLQHANSVRGHILYNGSGLMLVKDGRQIRFGHLTSAYPVSGADLDTTKRWNEAHPANMVSARDHAEVLEENAQALVQSVSGLLSQGNGNPPTLQEDED